MHAQRKAAPALVRALSGMHHRGALRKPYSGRRIDDGPNAITQGAGSVGDGERLTAQMARHCGHHRKRLPPCIFFRTSTGERRHSGHGSSTSSGLSMRGVPWFEKERPARPGERGPSRSRGTPYGGWSATRPLASARPLQWGGRSTSNARVVVCRHSRGREPSKTNGVERRS
jgi:hypothetical protein